MLKTEIQVLRFFASRLWLLALLQAFIPINVVADELPYSTHIVAANPDAGFHYAYILRIPNDSLSSYRRFLVVESNNTGVDDNYDNHLRAARSSVDGWGMGPLVASRLNVPLLVPVFPRSESDSLVYTHALDRDTLLLAEGQARRLDLQLLNMIQDAQHRLLTKGMEVRKKFVLVGFSASGTFSNRFAFLHPERLVAVVSGAVNSFPMLPIAETHGQKLDYPLGLSDFSRVTGSDFNLQAWKALPQMIFMGAVDENDAVEKNDAYSPRERELIYEYIGEDMQARWSKSQEIYHQLIPNVSFTTYGQVGHATGALINGDVVHFVDVAMKRAAAKTQPDS